MKLTSILSVLLSLAVVSQAAPMTFSKRRFGQEHTKEADATFQEVKDLAQGSDKEAQAGNLSGAMVRALLAKAPACDQQDRADEVIDLGQEFGGDKLKQYIKVAQTYRQLERNTPKAGQPSELCKKAPRHKELNGLVQAQDPTGNGGNNGGDNGGNKGGDKGGDNGGNTGGDNGGNKGGDKGGDKGGMCNGGNTGGDTGGDNGGNTGGDNGGNTGGNTDGSTNQAETNPVGGVKMPKIQKSGDKFVVNGNQFNDIDAAHGRQCDIQHNLCFNKFNGGDKSFSGSDCDNQDNVCKDGPPVLA